MEEMQGKNVPTAAHVKDNLIEASHMTGTNTRGAMPTSGVARPGLSERILVPTCAQSEHRSCGRQGRDELDVAPESLIGCGIWPAEQYCYTKPNICAAAIVALSS